jgi:hypothetical protein
VEAAVSTYSSPPATTEEDKTADQQLQADIQAQDAQIVAQIRAADAALRHAAES